ETPLPPPTDTPPGPPTPIPGWLTYHNDLVGYSFDYPPEAELTSIGVTGFPTEELPPGLTPSDYFATLEATYPDDLCVSLNLPLAFLTIQAPYDAGGRYSDPCGVSGIGVYDVVTADQTVLVGGTPYAATLTQLYVSGTGVMVSEFMVLHLENGSRVDLGGSWESSGSYEAYVAERDTLLTVLASFRWD
ncbi:MAG: hypothetical protein AB1449_12785, partial [Chloroflexota bacterium]